MLLSYSHLVLVSYSSWFPTYVPGIGSPHRNDYANPQYQITREAGEALYTVVCTTTGKTAEFPASMVRYAVSSTEPTPEPDPEVIAATPTKVEKRGPGRPRKNVPAPEGQP